MPPSSMNRRRRLYYNQTKPWLPANTQGLLFCLPLVRDADAIWASGKHATLAPRNETVDANGYFVQQDGILKAATVNVLRIGGGTDKTSGRMGALIEGARINSYLQSEDFSTTSVSFLSTVNTDAVASPDGNSTADELVEDSTSANNHKIEQSISVTSGQNVAFSVFAKKNTRTEIKLQLEKQDLKSVWFNLDTGTKGTVGASVVASGMDALPNGWYRCWVVAAAASTGLRTYPILLGSGGETDVYDGDGSSGVYIWGAQCEENVPFPSSYIKTTTAAVMRAGDDLRFDNTSQVNVKAAEGTFYFAYSPIGEPGGNNRIIDLQATVPNNAWKIFSNTAGIGSFEFWSNVSAAAFNLGQVETRGSTFVICVVWKVNDFRAYVDGVEKGSNTLFAAPEDISATIYIGQASSTTAKSFANMAHIHSYDAAHDAALVALKTKEIQRWLRL